jgi:glycerophosphoryl diester phosphodiesterase
MAHPAVVYHKAMHDDGAHPPNSLAAIAAALDDGAAWIEIDVLPLAYDDYMLVHDFDLASETTGSGFTTAATPEAVRGLHIVHDGHITDHRPPLLSDVVALMASHPGTARLQIDYKFVFPTQDDEPLARLARLIAPLGQRALVSTGADWHLTRLHALGGDFDLGFDIGFYLDARPEAVDPRLPPHRLGAYGYHDDHPLAAQRMVTTARYLELRCEALHAAVPFARVWYVSHRLITRCLEDGFNMAAWLKARDVLLDAWTIDAGTPGAAHVPTLADAGVSLFTSNTPRAIAALLTR